METGVRHDGILQLHVRHTGGQNGQHIPQQPDQDGHADQEAEIEILCVKHTLLAVAKSCSTPG